MTAMGMMMKELWEMQAMLLMWKGEREEVCMLLMASGGGAGLGLRQQDPALLVHLFIVLLFRG